ncbi:hypothetical protein [Streptomyces sp. NPDC002785]|uniref:hypothetical protein n=1 Tax=Streptomyces sp. NPDC002785 TaxID=3154543 RepID=UPI0033287590
MQVVDNAIRDAIKNVMLDPFSVAGCLVPPIDMVRANSEAGHYKADGKTYPVHDVVSKAAKRVRADRRAGVRGAHASYSALG